MKTYRLLCIASISFSAYSLFFVFNGQLFFAISAIACAAYLQILAELDK